ncbi:MAG: GTP cyclohydrolase II, partial [Burkholderiales bacterium]|nr:GTP cyclohydrolase II [Burkholderiales bacterium]
HSECLTGDVFHSLRCDCGEQLDIALKTIEQEQQGIIIYLKQEGRGIGLINKLKAYQLQNAGYDTFDANLKLGFAADLREYFIAAQILKDLDITTIKLATNNPQKIKELEQYGIIITDRVEVKSSPHNHNINYLQTKIKKFGHLL